MARSRRGGLKSIFAHKSTPSSPSPSSSSSLSASPIASPIHTFSESMMEENIEIAESMIRKWNTENSNHELFSGDRREAKEFIKSVKNLQRAMHYFVSENTSHEKLVHAQNLMQVAMKRLEKEFYQILSSNRDHLDPETISVSFSSHASFKSRSSCSDEDEIGSEDEIQIAEDSVSESVSTIAMSDLKMIAECMISLGYSKECVKIYKIIRKSIIDEGLYRLGIERLSSHQIQKMEWEVLEVKIKSWLGAMKVAVNTLFAGERFLCDFVFSNFHFIRESCFSDIAKEGAISLFQFPEFVAKGKKSSEKMFRILDLYDSVSDLWPHIESIFSFESTSIVRSQAIASLLKLGEAIRAMLMEFESAIEKDMSKSALPGGGVHPLTRYVMNYLCFLSDYSGILFDVVADWPLPAKAAALPDDTYFETSSLNGDEDSLTKAITVRFAWLILVLLCKLDGKAELYKVDVSLSYLFLANNLNYIVSKVRSSNLHFLLGENWISKHESKVRQYSSNYERMAWNNVLATIPSQNSTMPPSIESVKECFNNFNSAFESAYRKQSAWVVPDEKLRNEIKVSICGKLVNSYRRFYDEYGVLLRNERNSESFVRYSPDDLVNYLSDLFSGSKVSGSSSNSSSVNSRSSR
ncbi:hypothetical protein Scep_015735 [Stephania cephalantha]|uniref:Exocyst subunit Exo70 family protein n=1 Tax=Stephania cephalantha TaxID=152367 RepID=A0AAP0J3R5_9MAGN